MIGLTGGIAAGKSTVAKLWQSLGGIEIDADVIAREVVAKGTLGSKQIAEVFGERYFLDGELDRKALGAYVFSNPAARQQLEEIVHPLVRAEVARQLKVLPSEAMVIYTVPLLVEASVDLPFDAVVTVEAPEDIRINRLVVSRGMAPEEAQHRINSQAQPIDRAQRADYILNSNQSLDLLLADARKLWLQLELKANR